MSISLTVIAPIAGYTIGQVVTDPSRVAWLLAVAPTSVMVSTGETGSFTGLPTSTTGGTVLSGIGYAVSGVPSPYLTITQPGGTEGARIALSGGAAPGITVTNTAGTLMLRLYDGAIGGNLVATASVAVAASGSGGGSSGSGGSSSGSGSSGTGLNLRGAWAAATAYAVGDTVTYQGSSYGCTTAHTSASTFNGADWQLLAQAGAAGQGFNARGAWQASTAYNAYDVVTYGGSAYYAPTGGVAAASSFSAGSWTLMAAAGAAGQGFNARGAWTAGTAYNGYDVVTNGGATYYAPTGGVAAAGSFSAGSWTLMAAAGVAGAPGQAGQGFNLRGAWAASTAYNLDDVVTYLGQSYAAIAAFTSGSTFNAANWQLVAAAGATGLTGAAGTNAPTLSFQGAWQANTAYTQGQMVVQGGVGYAAPPGGVTAAATFSAGSWVVVPIGQAGPAGQQGQGFALKGVFTPSTAYGVDDVVTYQGQAYASIAAFTSAASFNPANWQMLAAQGAAGQGFNARGAWAASTAYNAYDVVTNGGNSYYAPAAISAAATFVPASWVLMAAAGATGQTGQGFNLRGAWAASTAYALDDVVSYQGQSYAAIAAFTSGGTFNAANWQMISMAGATGATGASLLQGTGAPSSGTGNDGDSYVDAVTGNFYKRVSGTWVLTGSLKGTTGSTGGQGIQGIQGIQGTTGVSFREGTTAPAAGLGSNGDTYLNTTTGAIYLNSAGTWTQTENIIGPVGGIGPAGAALLRGSGVPTSALGNNGDTYIDLATANVYAKASGAWTLAGNIQPATIGPNGLTVGTPPPGALFPFSLTGTAFDSVATLAMLQSLFGSGGGGGGGATGSIVANTGSVAAGASLGFTYAVSGTTTPFVALVPVGTAAGTATPVLLTAVVSVAAGGTSGSLNVPNAAGAGLLALMSGATGPVIAVSGTVTVTSAAGTPATMTGAQYSTGGFDGNEGLSLGYGQLSGSLIPASPAYMSIHVKVPVGATPSNANAICISLQGSVTCDCYVDTSNGHAVLNANGTYVVGSIDLRDGNDHELCVSESGGNLYLFEDGASIGNTAGGFGTVTTIWIGNSQANGNPLLSGSGVVISDYELQSGTRTASYARQTAPTTAGTSGLVVECLLNGNGNTVT